MSARVPARTPEAELALRVDRRSGLLLEQKPFNRPFERVLARAELDGLCGGTPDFRDPAPEHVLAPATADPALLRDRLAYWQRVGELGPTAQARLEARGDDELPSRRRLRYAPHGLHAYRGKFFPQLVRSLLNAAALPQGAIVVDPMCGSGTALCEARSLGMRAWGLDLNPLSVLVSRAKAEVLSVDPVRLVECSRRVLAGVSARPDPRPAWAEGDEGYLRRWFDARALDEVARIQAVLAQVEPDLSGWYRVCLSSVLREISWQDEADLRVRRAPAPYRRGAATAAFLRAVERAVESLVERLRRGGPAVGPPVEVREGDARRADETLRAIAGGVDAIVTSPPYACALPYLDTDRLSLCVLGLLPRVGHRRRESQMVGTREIGTGERRRLETMVAERRHLLPTSARRLIAGLADAFAGDEVGFRRKNTPALLGKYLLDMRDVLAATRALARPGAPGFWVVGNNSTTVRGDRVEIPTDRLLGEIAVRVGWERVAEVDMQLLASRDIFRRNRGTGERLLVLRAVRPRSAVYGTAPPSSEESWDFHAEPTQEHLHALHPWPARFVPQIPRRAIARWTRPGERVLDPFAGGGTTLLEAALADRPSTGIDNNAVACLVARAKTRAWRRVDLEPLRTLARALARGDALGTAADVPDYPNRDHWFSPEALQDLGQLRARVRAEPEPRRTLALAVFSSIVLRASRQDSDTRYARTDRVYRSGSALRWFARRLEDATERAAALVGRPRARADVLHADARALAGVPPGSVSLVVTSPPYLNAYDYHKYHRHRLHWIDGDVAMARDLEIGKHDTFTRPGARPDAYFDDLTRCFRAWRRVLVPGGRVLLVVGDAIVGGEPVAVADELVARLAAEGFRLEHHLVRRLETARKSFNPAARIDREHVLVAVADQSGK
jgi:site-specific DNA-methyltransferase (cytosine-N4-specific)